MSDSTGSAASLIAGNPNPPPSDTPPPAGNQQTPPPGEPTQFWATGVDPELQQWAEKKGWKSPAEALISHRNLEKYLGGEKIPVPKGADDAVGWDMVYKALGRPDLPDGYGLDKIEGFDPDFAKSAAEAFHGAGITGAQAAKLAEWHKSLALGQVEKMESAFLEQAQLDMQQLKQEWGQAYEPRIESARRAALQFGVDVETANKLERALGTKGMMEFMSKIGMKMTESPSIGMSKTDHQNFTTPEEARREIDMMKSDPEMSKRLYNGDAAARAKMERLQKIAAGVA